MYCKAKMDYEHNYNFRVLEEKICLTTDQNHQIISAHCVHISGIRLNSKELLVSGVKKDSSPYRPSPW